MQARLFFLPAAVIFLLSAPSRSEAFGGGEDTSFPANRNLHADINRKVESGLELCARSCQRSSFGDRNALPL